MTVSLRGPVSPGESQCQPDVERENTAAKYILTRVPRKSESDEVAEGTAPSRGDDRGEGGIGMKEATRGRRETRWQEDDCRTLAPIAEKEERSD